MGLIFFLPVPPHPPPRMHAEDNEEERETSPPSGIRPTLAGNKNPGPNPAKGLPHPYTRVSVSKPSLEKESGSNHTGGCTHFSRKARVDRVVARATDWISETPWQW